MSEQGLRFGPFLLEGEIGSGSLASVHRALVVEAVRTYRGGDLLPGMRVALKILHARVTSDPQALRRFEREAEQLAALEHPSILPVFTWGEWRGRHYLVFPLMQGSLDGRRDQRAGSNQAAETLVRAEVDRTPDPVADVAWLLERFGEALEGLAWLHEHDVVHRDVKPANLLLDQDGRCRLGDFGLSRPLAAETVTFDGELVGTPAYMAPEVLFEGHEPDKRADLYSLAASFYELATGVPPRRPGSWSNRRAVPSLGARRPDLPAGFVRLIDRCLERDPALRFADAGEAVTAWTRWRSEGLPPPRASGWLRVQRRVFRNRAAALAVSLVLAAAFVSWYLVRREERFAKAQRILQDVRLLFNPAGLGADQNLARLADAERLDPKLPDIQLERARILLEASRFDEAWEALGAARRLGARGPILWSLELAVGRELEARGRPVADAGRLREAAARLAGAPGPKSAQEAFVRALTLLAAGRPQDALALVSSFEGRDPRLSIAFERVKLFAYSLLGDSAAAVREAHGYFALPVGRKDPTALRLAVLEAASAGDRDAALEFLGYLEDLAGKDDFRYLEALAQFLTKERGFEGWSDAVHELLRHWVEADPERIRTARQADFQIRLRLLRAAVDRSVQPAEMTRDVERIVQAFPKSGAVFISALHVLLLLGRRDEAARLVQRARDVPLDPLQRQTALALAAMVAWRRGRHAEAEKLYRELVERYPRNADARTLLARLLWVRAGFHRGGRPLSPQETAKIRALLDEAFRIRPDHPMALSLLFEILARSTEELELRKSLSVFARLRRKKRATSFDYTVACHALERLEDWPRLERIAQQGLAATEAALRRGVIRKATAAARRAYFERVLELARARR